MTKSTPSLNKLPPTLNPFADREALVQLTSRAPNFKSNDPLMIVEQVFGDALMKYNMISQKKPAQIIKKNQSIRSIKLKPLILNKPKDDFLLSKMNVNLELLLYIAYLMESLPNLADQKAFDLIYFRCIEWWEESGKLHNCFRMFYNVLKVLTVRIYRIRIKIMRSPRSWSY